LGNPKEIRQQSIPQSDNPARVVNECLRIEQEMEFLMEQLAAKREEKEKILCDALRRTGK